MSLYAEVRKLLADLNTWQTYVTPDVHTDPGYIVTTVSKGQVAGALRLALAAHPEPATPATGPTLTSREIRKGTGDMLRDLEHAQRMTDTSEPGFGEVICRGRELDFVNRAIRVAIGEIKQTRKRHTPVPPETPSEEQP